MSTIGVCSYPRHASSASAFISVAEKKRQISVLTALNSLIAILVHATGSQTTEAIELIDGKVAASLEKPLNGRRRRTSVLELIIYNNDLLK